MAYHTADQLLAKKYIQFDKAWKAYRVSPKHAVAYQKTRPLVEFIAFDLGGEVCHAYDQDGEVVKGNVKTGALVFEVMKVV